MAPYDRGVRFAVVSERDGQPNAWFDGGSGIHGGRVLITPDREYRLRSRLPLLGRWRVTEGRSPIAKLREVSRRDVELLVEPQALPAVPDDAALVIVLACAIAVLQRSTPSIAGGEGG